MTKTTSLSADLNLIKELEELRLKQKLLIDSIKKKDSSKQDSILKEINSKLDFVVNLFKDANEDSEDSTHQKVEEIEKKFTELQTNLESRFDKLEELIKSNSSENKKNSSSNSDSNSTNSSQDTKDSNLPPKPDFDAQSIDDQSTNSSKKELDISNRIENIKSVGGNKSESTPPLEPLSKNDVKNVAKDDEKKSKKKWF